ncbi:MAG: hypothetical protein ACTSP0_01350 [Alphaproteobacteria bacterium]
MAARLIRFGTAYLSLILGVALPVNASAKPLTSEACVRLVDEHGRLSRGGIEKSLARDPASARDNIKAEQLALIERFLFIESQIRFRCPAVKLPGLEITPPSKAQTAKVEKKQSRPRGPMIPLPKRKPASPAKRAG